MALFGKDRERSDRPRGFGPGAAPVPPRDPAPREGEMFERDKTTQVDETGGTSAFLGKGSRVSGRLSFEGTVRIDGQLEGEITARAALTIGGGAVVHAHITGRSVLAR